MELFLNDWVSSWFITTTKFMRDDAPLHKKVAIKLEIEKLFLPSKQPRYPFRTQGRSQSREKIDRIIVQQAASFQRRSQKAV